MALSSQLSKIRRVSKMSISFYFNFFFLNCSNLKFLKIWRVGFPFLYLTTAVLEKAATIFKLYCPTPLQDLAVCGTNVATVE
jgi:hypothetical protein